LVNWYQWWICCVHAEHFEIYTCPWQNLSGLYLFADRTLGADAIPATEEPPVEAAPERAVHTITFWRNGFTVDDGPLRKLEDPANSPFLNVRDVSSVSAVKRRMLRRLFPMYCANKMGMCVFATHSCLELCLSRVLVLCIPAEHQQGRVSS
jgi:hypothetical protein